MNGVPTQIFDMLLGNIAPIEQLPQLPTGAESSGAPILFGAILGDLLNPGQDSPVIPFAPTETTVADVVSAIIADGTAENKSDRPGFIPSNPTNENSQPAAKTLLDFVSQPLSENAGVQIESLADVEVVDSKADSNVLRFNTELQKLLPQADFEFNPAVKDLLTHKPVEIKSGEYEIIRQEVSSDKIELTLKNPNETEPIKLIFPADILKRTNSETVRVDVNARLMPGASSEIDDLLQNLNLKRLEISTTPEQMKQIADGKSVTNSGSNEPVQITLVGEQSGHAFLIKKKLDRASLQVSRPTESVSGKPVVTGKPTVIAEPIVLGRQTGDIEIVRPVAEPIIAKPSVGMTPMEEFGFTELPRNFANAAKGNAQPTATAMSADGEFAEMAAIHNDKMNLNRDVPVAPQPKVARFTLPDDIRTALRPGGNSVTINIEPEHLGHARLNLVLRGDGLRARVIVESVQAKALVEKSIDQLTDQLSRVDVKVESIEVSVGNRDAGNQFFRHSHAWRSQVTKRPNENSSLEATQELIPEMNYAPTRESYVSSSGVDLVA